MTKSEEVKIDRTQYVNVESLVKAMNALITDVDISEYGTSYWKGRLSFCNDIKVWLHDSVGISLRTLGL